ncbi:MAG TPA: AMP-binding protein, partial [Candidatus Sumerlaeota bacterium]|nr:AMP-binding protein [Candidatus Sumerlaeota bacterium]
MKAMTMWNEKYETMPREELHALQLIRLKKVVRLSYDNNIHYRNKMDAAGINPEDIRSLDDLTNLPFMTKDDFRATYPLGMLCVDKKQLREMHMSSGSTGVPVVMAYTDDDIAQWAECMARCYYMAGINQGDVIQITPSFGLFNGGFGFYHGARMAGLFIIPTGAGNTPRQIRLMKDFNVRALMGVVSYGIRIMEILEEQKTDLPDLKIGIFGAETFSNSMRKKIEGGLGIETFDIYGMTETGGVGKTGMDCPAHEGIHVWEDQYITEVV